MKEIKVAEVYDVTQISKGNDKAWILLQREIEKLRAAGCTDDIMLDFDSIELFEPWLNMEFCKILQDDSIHLKIYNSDTLKATLDIKCLSLNSKEGRIHNVTAEYITYEKDNMPEGIKEKKENMMKAMLEKGVHETEDGYLLMLNDVIDQVGSRETVSAIKTLIYEHLDNNRSKKFVIDTEYMFIQKNILKVMAEMVKDLGESGMFVEIKSDDDETSAIISSYLELDFRTKLSQEEKVKIIKEQLKLGTVGLLGRYKQSRSKDELGRMGKGEVVTNRPAIYLGVGKKKSNESYVMKIREYSASPDKFCTKLDYSLDADGGELEELESSIIYINLDNIGFSRFFVGEMCHFSLPVQTSNYGCKSTYYIEEADGETKIMTKRVTVPEYMKMVLDDFNVEYNREVLDGCIDETRKRLSFNN